MKPSTPKSPSQLQNSFDPDEVMDTLALLAGIDIPESSRAMVATHLEVAAAMADIVEAAPIEPDKMEPANVFTPGEVLENKNDNRGLSK